MVNNKKEKYVTFFKMMWRKNRRTSVGVLAAMLYVKANEGIGVSVANLNHFVRLDGDRMRIASGVIRVLSDREYVTRNLDLTS